MHLLNSVRADWQQVGRQVCRAVLATRQEASLRILNGSYAAADAIFLQEAAPAFPARLASSAATLARTHLALVPPPVPGRERKESLGPYALSGALWHCLSGGLECLSGLTEKDHELKRVQYHGGCLPH